MSKLKLELAKLTKSYVKYLIAATTIVLAGCASSGEKMSRQEACFIYGNAHQIFHEVYLTESDAYIQDYLSKERKKSEDFATILEYRSNQFKNFSPIEVNMVLTHACVKHYHLNTYEFTALRQCLDKKDNSSRFNCVDTSLKLSHMEQNTKIN